MKAKLRQFVFVIMILGMVACLYSQTTVTLGNGSSITGIADASPVNLHYRSLRGQMVVTADELLAAGISGTQVLTSIGFFIQEAPLYALPDFKLRIASVWNDDVSVHYSAPMKTVYSVSSYLPTAGGYQILSLNDSYIWDGISNLLIDISFNLAQDSHDSGTVQYSSFPNGFRYVGSNDAYQLNAVTETVVDYRPNIRLSFSGYTQIGWSDMAEPSPFGNTTDRYQGSISIYKPAEIGDFGLITHLGWKIRSTSYFDVPIKIYMKTTELSYFNSNTRNYHELKNGATEVFSGTVKFNHLGWITLDIQDFDYGENNLMVFCESLLGYKLTSNYATFASTFSNLIYPTNMKHQWFSGGSLADYGPAFGLGNINDKLPNIVMLGITANPRTFTATAASYTQIDLEWTENLHENKVMILSNTADSFGNPINGEPYQVGDMLPGGASVIYIGEDLAFSHTELEPNTRYYYRAVSVDVNHYSTGVYADATTHLAPYTGFPLIETFEDNIYPPYGWVTDGPSNFWYTSNDNGAYGLSYYSIQADLGMWDPAVPASLISPLLDLSSLPHPSLSFDFAHTSSRYETSRLEIFCSSDNGASYSLLATMSGEPGGSLDTGGPGLEHSLPLPQQWSSQIIPLPAGTNRVKLSVTADGGRYLYLDNIAIGSGNPEPQIHVAPFSKHFGDIQISLASVVQNFSLKNVGAQSLSITAISFDGGEIGEFTFTGLSAYPQTLAPGDELFFTAQYQAQTTGARFAQIRISTDTANVEDFVVRLYGTGIDKAARELPYIQTWDLWDEDEEGSSQGWQTFNLGMDGYAWSLWWNEETNNIDAQIPTYMNIALDDWFISGAIELQQGINYSISYDYKRDRYTSQQMKLAVGRAQDPAAMLTVLADHPAIENTDYINAVAEFNPSVSGLYFFGFHAYSSAQAAYNGTLFLDNIRVLLPNSQISQATAAAGTVTLDFEPISVQGLAISPGISISGLSGNPTLNVSISDQAPWAHPNAGLCFKIDGAELGGATITITHNLGFIPTSIGLQTGTGGLYLIENPGDWTDQQIQILLPSSKSGDSVKILFPKNDTTTLPIQLSSFTAALSSHEYVQIAWTVQSETSHAGYNILRAETPDLSLAIAINSELITNGLANGTQVSYLYSDMEIEPDKTYYYWLESVATFANSSYYGPQEVYVTADPNDPANPAIPYTTELLAAYPNPFNPSTTINYALAEGADVTIEILNMRGQRVRSFHRSHPEKGKYQLLWDGRDSRGITSASGVYLYRMSSGTYSASGKIVMLK